MKFPFKRILAIVLALAMILPFVPEVDFDFAVKVSAATTTNFESLKVADLGVSVNGTNPSGYASTASWEATSANAINGSLTGYKEASGFTQRYWNATSTLTFTNNKNTTAQLSFSYTATPNDTACSVTVNGETITTTKSGKVEQTLEAGGTVTIVLSVNKRESGFFQLPPANTTTIAITNIALIAEGSSTVTFGATTNGSYTVTKADGTAATVPGSVSAPSTDEFTLTATPAAGYAFAGWYSGDTFLSGDIAWKKRFDADMTVAPKFVPNTGSKFGVGDARFSDLGTALTAAATGSDKTIVLLEDATLTGEYTIPAGVTLLIPKDASQTKAYGENLVAGPQQSAGQFTKPSAFRTLTLDAGATLIVNGNLEVGAIHVQTQGAHAVGGAVYGTYGCINTEKGSSIILNDGANLFAWGYVLGDGTVTANDGATVYEKMQVTDYRGGKRTTSMAVTNASKKAFPFSQYYVQNVEAKTVLNPGSTIKAHATIYSDDGPQSTTTNFIGEGAMFAMGSDTVLIKEYDPATDRLIISAAGKNTADSTVGLNGVALELEGIAVDSAKFILPINSNITINLSGCTATVNQDLLLQPGVKFNLAKDATVIANAKIYVFDSEQWGNYVFDGKKVAPLQYVPSLNGPSNRTISSDAVIDLNGRLIVNKGIYTTASGACVISSQNTGVIKFGVAASSGTVYQATGHGLGGWSTDFAAIDVVSAKLTNGDGTITLTEKAAANDIFVYDSLTKKWMEVTGNIVLDFDLNGGTDGPGNHTITLEGLQNGTENTVVVIPTTQPGRDGYEFVGWATSDGGDVVFLPGKEYEISLGQSTTLYAVWQAYTYTVTWKDINGNVIGTESVKYGQSATGVAHPEISNEQYKYVPNGWSLTKGGEPLASIPVVTGDVTYYAVYIQTTQEYTVTLPNKTFGAAYGTTVTISDTATKAPDANAHYIFAGWDSNGDGKVDVAVNGTITVTGNVTLTPVFTSVAHSWGTGEVTKAPTCTDAGVRTYTCSCGETKTEAIVAAGHTHAAAVKENEVAATCKAEGSYDLVVKCSICGTEISRETKTIEKLPHTEVVDAAKAPTCTETGLTEGKHCSTCGEVLVAQEVVKELGHTLTQVGAKAPTCTEVGHEAYEYCTECDYSTYVEIPATHIPGKAVVENIVNGNADTNTPAQYDLVSYCTKCKNVATKETVTLETVVFKGMTMALNDSLQVRFTMFHNDMPETGTYVVLTRIYANGKESITVTSGCDDWSTDKNLDYVFAYNDLAAAQMTDIFNVVLYTAEGEIIGVYSSSISEYLTNSLIAEEQGQNRAAIKTLYVDLLNYGAAAQNQFKYATNNLANKNLTEAQKAYATICDFGTSNPTLGEGGLPGTMSLTSRIELNFNFTSTTITDDMYAVATYVLKGKAYTVKIENQDFAMNKDGTWRIPVGMPLVGGQVMVTCTIYNGDGEVVTSSVDSMEGYLVRKNEESGGTLPVLKTIWAVMKSAAVAFGV